MRTIGLDASAWMGAADFYGDLLGAIGAPAWHGRTLDALVDSIVTGGVNGVAAPYRIEVGGLDRAAADARAALLDAFAVLAEDGAPAVTILGHGILEVRPRAPGRGSAVPG